MANKLGASASGDRVKLETMASVKLIPSATRYNNFAVLVRVTAPRKCTESSRAGVDLVAVLDVSGSMWRDNRMDRTKQAMMFVIDNLGPDDRLSVVSFNDVPQRRTELSVMSDVNRERAKAEVLALTPGGNDDMGAAMKEAAEILRRRGAEERSNRLGRIIFLSDGQNDEIFRQYFSPEFPAETFGLGADHDPDGLRYIADKTLGVYSYVNQDLEKIRDAFAQSIGGLKSVTAMDVQINLQTREDVSISSIESGGYRATIGSDRRSGTIHIQDLYTGEQKNFIVYLTTPEGKEKLMTVNGWYRNPKISKQTAIQIDGSEVAVRRAKATKPSNEAACPDVAAELVRLRLVKDISDIAKHPTHDGLQRSWNAIKASEDGHSAPESTLSDLGDDVVEMQREGKPFIFSWLTSHLWQRATTKGSPSRSGAFRTKAMEKMTHKVDNPQSESESEPEVEQEPEKEPEVEQEPEEEPEVEQEPEKQPEVEEPGVAIIQKNQEGNMCEKVITWARNNPFSCALPCVALLLLAGAFLPMLLHRGAPASEPTTTIVLQVGDVNEGGRSKDGEDISLDISKHQGWLKVEKSLEVIMLKKMEDAGITSFLHAASAEDMSHATNRYLLLALVHASILGTRCASAPTISLLQQKVQALKAEKMELSVKIETLAKHKEEETAAAAANRAACKDNDEALERANTRIAELERQLQDKKAFADSLLSEVANADAHLKTCNQRVDMLEAKVRELEGVPVEQ